MGTGSIANTSKAMNYIKHINGVLQQFSGDSRLNPTHISLYIALFQLWNIHRFPEVFFIAREEVMQKSKIGSITTYHRCLRNLNDWKYIDYLPSHNPYKGSEIKMFIFEISGEQDVNESETSPEQVVNKPETSPEQVVNKYETSPEQALVSNINMIKHDLNIIKHYKNINKQATPENYFEVFNFFKIENKPEAEALHFFNYYQAKGWKFGDNSKMKDWKVVAKSWIRKSESSKTFYD
ncbi:MAG: hypothetical protein MUP24_00405, partial [Gillisia sp.]|nr:hypothetical protein [Gillisia sp.]